MKIKSILILMVFFFTIAMLNSCLSSKETLKEDTNNDEPLIVEEQQVDTHNTYKSNVILIENDLENRELVDGYRIKVASKNNLEEANKVEQRIVNKIDSPVYIEFIVDRYMVYVGDCQNKKEADELKGKLKALGFTKIYSVPKKVYKRESYVTKKATYVGDVLVKNSANEIEKTVVEDKIYGKQVLGYRVQVFAGLNRDNARRVKEVSERKTKEKVYILLKDDLFKVQIGDLKSRIDAENLREKLEQELDFSGAFIVNTLIFNKLSKNESINISSSLSFFIQIGAYSSESNAKKLLEMATVYGYENSTISSDGDLHKVLIGGYDSRDGTEVEKEKLIELGFEGAWILER